MTNKRIPDLTTATTPLAGTELVPLWDGTGTKQVSVTNLTAGRAVAGTQFTASTGNFVPATSGNGIDFSAVTPAAGMTSKVLTNYEEGTWTPGQGGGLAVVGAFSSAGTYTRIGRKVTVCGSVTGATSVATTAGGLAITGLPFSMGASPGSGTMFSSSLTAFGVLAVSGTSIYAMNAISGGTISFTITYEV